LYFTTELSTYVEKLQVWGFLVAFLFNLSINTSRPHAHTIKPALTYSFIMLVSYLLSDLWPWEEDARFVYIMWGSFDLATALLLLAGGYFHRFKDNCILFYLIVGLVLNLLLTIGIHIDLMVLRNVTPWWYWSFYSVGGSVVDVMMILVLILQRDYLGIYRLTLGRNKVQ